MQEWAKRNGAVVFMGIGIPLLMFANNAWMDSKISTHLRSYVPVVVWQQWADERMEWRKLIENDIKGLSSKQDIDRRDIDSKLHSMELKLDRVVTILETQQGKKVVP